MTATDAEKYLAKIAKYGVDAMEETTRELYLLRKEIGIDMASVRNYAKKLLQD